MLEIVYPEKDKGEEEGVVRLSVSDCPDNGEEAGEEGEK
jgi:hypothetical protein